MNWIVRRLHAIFLLLAGTVVIASKPVQKPKPEAIAPDLKSQAESAAPVVKPLAKALRRAA